MLQVVATITSIILLAVGCGVVAASLSDDWALMLQALGLRRPRLATMPVPPQGRPIVYARQIRVVRISPRSAPHRAAA
jgi:hypothetical protein